MLHTVHEIWVVYSKCSKISNTFLFLFSVKILVFRAGIRKMLVRIAKREDPDQTALKKQPDLGLCCLSGVATSVRNFRTFTVQRK